MKITEFFKTDYVDFASYDNLRKIASYIDGCKNTSRKILYTVIDKNITQEIKVDQLSNKMAEHTQYLHGGAQGVIVTMAQNYVGTNNLPLLTREGNFGTRFSPEASAPRYIYTMKEKYLNSLFNKEDNDILISQEFEGDKIEPRFYVPTLPLFLINGSEGISSGFAQKVLGRNPKDIKNYIENRLTGSKKKVDLTPFFQGFDGVVEAGEESHKWNIKGVIKRKSITQIEITELPIGYNLQSYIKVLDELEEKKIIKSYKDISDNDKFHFIVTLDSKDLRTWSDDTILDKLKLVKRVSENYTAIDEDNKIREFSSVIEILDSFIDIRMKYFTLRKENSLNNLKHELRILASKYIFVKSVIDGNIEVNNKKKEEIVSQIEAIGKITPDEGSYDFLLRMPIYSLTEEKVADLLKQINEGKEEYKEIMNTPESDLWLKDLAGV